MWSHQSEGTEEDAGGSGGEGGLGRRGGPEDGRGGSFYSYSIQTVQKYITGAAAAARPTSNASINIYTTNICIRIAIVIEYLILYPTKYRGTERPAPPLITLATKGGRERARGSRNAGFCRSRGALTTRLTFQMCQTSNTSMFRRYNHKTGP